MAKVLLYNISDGEKLTKLKLLCFKLGIELSRVAEQDFARPIGTLLALEGADDGEDTQSPRFQREMLVMHELSGAQFNALLDGMRRMKAGVALKAVVTQSNMRWSSNRLYRELSAEHEAMERARGKSVHKSRK